MNKWPLPFAFLALTVAIADLAIGRRWVVLPGLSAQRTTAAHADNICGPRCVAHILRHYGRPADLLEIVREIQYPDIKAGATFADIRSLLERSGIWTAVVHVPAGYSLAWDHPAVAYMRGQDESRLGHYAVVVSEPGGARDASWDGIADVRQYRDAGLLAADRVVLVTAPQPVSLAEIQRRIRSESDVTLLALGIVCALGAVLVPLSPMAGRTTNRRGPSASAKADLGGGLATSRRVAGCRARLTLIRTVGAAVFLAMSLVVASICAAAAGSAAPRSADDDAALRESVLTNLRRSREQIQTGVFRAHGHEFHQFSKKRMVEGEVHIFCAFDIPQRRMRFDRTGPDTVNRGATARPSVTGRWFRNREKSVLKLADRDSVSVFASSDRPPPAVSAFDIRAFGLAYRDALQEPVAFEEIYDNGYLGADWPSTVTAETDDVYVITWKISGDYMLRKLWVSAARGYTPFRLDVSYPMGATPDSVDPAYRCDVAYKQIEGVWVPISLVANDRAPPPRNLPRRWSCEVALEWEAVNQPVPDELFTEESLGGSPGDLVVDVRSNAPIHTRRISAPAPPAPPENPIALRTALIVANSAIVAAIACMVFFRLWRRRLQT